MPDASSELSPVGVPIPVLDAACLDQLRGLDPLGESAFLLRVLNTYLRSLEGQRERAHAAWVATDWNGLSQVTHALKSASASIGAVQFSGLCARIEADIRQSRLEALSELMGQFSVQAESVRCAVQAVIARETPA